MQQGNISMALVSVAANRFLYHRPAMPMATTLTTTGCLLPARQA